MTIHTPNGWPASRDPAAIDVKGFICPGTTETIWLRADVAPLLLYWARRFNGEVQALEVAGEKLDEWGYFYRANKNAPSKLSEHSAGTAIDLNATKHPNGKRGTFTAEQVGSIDAILAAINHVTEVVEWGGNFHGVPDEMHLDIVGSLAQVEAVIARLHIQPDGSTAHPLPQEDDMVIAYTDPTAAIKSAAWVQAGQGRRWVDSFEAKALGSQLHIVSLDHAAAFWSLDPVGTAPHL